MKILVISGEVWRDDTNGGNVLSNIFKGFDAEFSQIYCNPGEPQNNLCKHYYQMTEGQAMRAFLKRKPIGQEIEYDTFPTGEEKEQTSAEQKGKKTSFFQKHKLGIFYFARDFLWNTAKWKNDKLKRFLDNANPDIIFAPCYGSPFMLKLTRFVAKYTGKKVISYISDDAYTLKQFRLSPYFWIRRFWVRRQMRKTFPLYSLCYTMTERQKLQCEKDFNANMKILRKTADLLEIPDKSAVNTPVKFVYAGGIYLNRWKTLGKIAKAIKEVNKDGVKATLDVYTANELTKKMSKLLDDKINSTVHGSVSLDKLNEIYKNSDVAIHAESFDLRNRLAVRMSFSTKIIDCLASGCACLAVCDSKQGGYEYLTAEDCAICVDDLNNLPNKISELVNNPDKIIEYANKAKDCIRRNHLRDDVSKMLREDFNKYSE